METLFGPAVVVTMGKPWEGTPNVQHIGIIRPSVSYASDYALIVDVAKNDHNAARRVIRTLVRGFHAQVCNFRVIDRGSDWAVGYHASSDPAFNASHAGYLAGYIRGLTAARKRRNAVVKRPPIPSAAEVL